MPWKGQTMEACREEFVRRVLNQEASKSELCRAYGISRPTGDKWIQRYLAGEALSDRSRKPHQSPNKTVGEVEDSIIELRKAHPSLGARKLRRILQKQGKSCPASSTVNAILHRNGLISKEASAASTPYVRYEKAFPNEMWQADFKGDIGMANGQRCHPLTVLDDHSRYLLCLDAQANEQLAGVQKSFLAMFRTYGLPDSVLCDNGNPWGTTQTTGYTRFEVWLMDLGILTKHGRIRHPQTQGKNERFNGTLQSELLKYHQITSQTHAQKLFDSYRQFYNEVRPHHALGLEVPSSRYAKSPRRMPGRIQSWEYDVTYKVRKVRATGYIRVLGRNYYLSESLGGRWVGIRESAGTKLQVQYRQFRVAEIDVEERVIVSRRARLLVPEEPQKL